MSAVSVQVQSPSHSNREHEVGSRRALKFITPVVRWPAKAAANEDQETILFG